MPKPPLDPLFGHATRPFATSFPFLHRRHPSVSAAATRWLSSRYSRAPRTAPQDPKPAAAQLTHVSPTGTLRMVDISAKPTNTRTALAFGYVTFQNPAVPSLIASSALHKGDALVAAQLAGIQAAKRTPDWIPLCHPLALSHVHVHVAALDPSTQGYAPLAAQSKPRAEIVALVTAVAATGVEMEALTAVMAAALTVVDMCKAVDRAMCVEGCEVVFKIGGKSDMAILRQGMHYRHLLRDLVAQGHLDERVMKQVELEEGARREQGDGTLGE